MIVILHVLCTPSVPNNVIIISVPFCFLQDNFGRRIEGEEAKAVIYDSSVDRES